ncbi:hypothetical protein F5Y14DRAFT_445290 [Nemania sp. NC0429]|nr:hypothetical protein F5Y14DRAFT_445290 [Nemania sp. NC0429]
MAAAAAAAAAAVVNGSVTATTTTSTTTTTTTTANSTPSSSTSLNASLNYSHSSANSHFHSKSTPSPNSHLTISARTLPTTTTAAKTTTAKAITTTATAAATATTKGAGTSQRSPLLAHAKGISALHSQARTNGTKRPRQSDHRDGRIAKSRQRPISSPHNSSNNSKTSMEPPVLSFYGTQPVPLPSRFANLKKRLVAGHEAALEASWGRLVVALRDEIKYIDERRAELIPSIDFTAINDAAQVAPFEASLKRHGLGVIRGVVPPEDASRWVEETKTYLETKHDFKPPPAQDPTCFDFFWTPAQVRSRAHPNMLRAQRFAMSLWNCNDDDRLATRFPITYADRIRIESTNNGIITVNGVAAAPPSPEDSLIAAAAAASNAAIAQVDNGSLERWELDGYGRCGLYDQIFRGNWEAYNAWDPAGRVNATSDLYNGAGACSMMRMFQGILALTVVEPGMIRLLPSPKLSTVYFLLRPFFSPKEPAPESGDGPEKWEAYLDPSNWALDEEQSTIIHGAVPGHAQRVTAAWHPHLELDKSLVTPPTLQAGDYIVWHPDQAYQFSNTNYSSHAKPESTGRPGPSSSSGASHTSMLVYSPAAPLTQTNALFLARQRKAFLRGHPGPDFDSTGTGLGSEAPHTGRLGEKEIREVGGEEGLRAMGLEPWTLEETTPPKSSPLTEEKKDVEMDDVAETGTGSGTATGAATGGTATPASASSGSRAESEVVRLANIILFPDRYDFYMPTRASSPVHASRDKEKEKEKEKERERDKDKDKDKDGDGDKEMVDEKEKGKDVIASASAASASASTSASTSTSTSASTSTSRERGRGKGKGKGKER